MKYNLNQVRNHELSVEQLEEYIEELHTEINKTCECKFNEIPDELSKMLEKNKNFKTNKLFNIK